MKKKKRWQKPVLREIPKQELDKWPELKEFFLDEEIRYHEKKFQEMNGSKSGKKRKASGSKD